MGSFGFAEMAFIAVFGLLVFGPKKLPEIARSVGDFVREFKAATNSATREFKAELDVMDRDPVAAVPAQGSSIPGSVKDDAPGH